MHRLFEPWLEILHLQVAVDDLQVLRGLVAEIFLELTALVAVMEKLDGLFKGDGDEEAENDGGDVNEEVAPGSGGVVRRVNVQHGVVLLRILGILGNLGARLRSGRLRVRRFGRRRRRVHLDGQVSLDGQVLWHGLAVW